MPVPTAYAQLGLHEGAGVAIRYTVEFVRTLLPTLCAVTLHAKSTRTTIAFQSIDAPRVPRMSV